MGRPKIGNKRKSISITIDKEINNILEKYCEELKLNKSQYIEFLIKKEKNKKPE